MKENRMKFNFFNLMTTLVVAILLSAMFFQANAQKKIEIFGLAGYQLNGDVTVARGELSFDDGMSYGLGIDIPVERYMSAEISWSMASSNVSLDEYLGSNVLISDLYIHTFQAGALVEPKKGQKVSPFGLFTLGATLFTPTEGNYDDEWRFSIALGGGVKIEMSDKVGLRLQGRLLIPMQFEGGSVYVGTGGAGVAIGAYTAFVQGDFSGGIYFRL
jgi:opacity protein-like surface antigen